MTLFEIVRQSDPLGQKAMLQVLIDFWPVLVAELLAVICCYRGRKPWCGKAERLWPSRQGLLLLPILVWGLLSAFRVNAPLMAGCGLTNPPLEWFVADLTTAFLHGGLLLAALFSLRILWLWPLSLPGNHAGLTGCYRTTLQIVLASVGLLQAFVLIMLVPSAWI